MIELQLSTQKLSTRRLVMIACSVALSATLAGCGSDYDPPPPYQPTTPPPVVSPTAQYINVVGLAIITPNADTIEPDAVDPTPAPTTENEEPVPVS